MKERYFEPEIARAGVVDLAETYTYTLAEFNSLPFEERVRFAGDADTHKVPAHDIICRECGFPFGKHRGGEVYAADDVPAGEEGLFVLWSHVLFRSHTCVPIVGYHDGEVRHCAECDVEQWFEGRAVFWEQRDAEQAGWWYVSPPTDSDFPPGAVCSPSCGIAFLSRFLPPDGGGGR